MFILPPKCVSSGSSKSNALLENGKPVVFRDPPKDEMFKYLPLPHADFGYPQTIHDSDDFILIVGISAASLILVILSLGLAVYFYCTGPRSKNATIKRLSLKQLGHIRRRFDSMTAGTPLGNALQSNGFARFENDQPESNFRDGIVNNNQVTAANSTPLRGGAPVSGRMTVVVHAEQRETPVESCSSVNLAPVHSTNLTPVGVQRPSWMLSTEERERRLRDRERRIQQRNDLFDRVLSDEDQYELYVVNEQHL